MLPYIIAFYGGQLGNNSKIAEKFYKIAAFSDDAPSVSAVLAVISGQPKDNPKIISENFALMALGGYDTEPYQCFETANEIIKILHT